ncbi:unnamed protein product [Parnassius apollo]|uniref:(apollo) hypothetical protein n=1 Tax=Parnassius apollo TaxID=110799 RepID=A0A8S3XXQ9_PARAO|nr:unnamed protein product [Parnassius apollo]
MPTTRYVPLSLGRRRGRGLRSLRLPQAAHYAHVTNAHYSLRSSTPGASSRSRTPTTATSSSCAPCSCNYCPLLVTFLYPWGVVEVENSDHCDFIKLRTMLITHMQDLQEVTQEVHYENYRSERLARNGQVPKRHTSTESGLSEADSNGHNGSNEDSSERERALREKEAELRRMQEMLEQMQRQMQLQAAASTTTA